MSKRPQIGIYALEKHRKYIYYQAINYEAMGRVGRVQQSRFGHLPFLSVFLGLYSEFLI